MYDLAERVRWQDIYDLLSSGYPPLILQLLAINMIFLILFILRRIWGRQSSENTSHTIQFLLILANCLIVYEQKWLPLLDGYVSAFSSGIHKI